MNEAISHNPTTGWEIGTVSPLGGKRSLRVEKARAEINAAGHPELAAFIPQFFMGRFWLPADAYRGWVQFDAARFQPPTPEQAEALQLSATQITQILQSLRYQSNFQYGVAQGAGLVGQDVGGYRGEADYDGFPTYVPTPIDVYGPDGLVQVTIPPDVAAMNTQAFWIPHQMRVSRVVAGHEYWAPTGSGYKDHSLCDVWFELQTDENLARYVRNWARAYGVSISADP